MEREQRRLRAARHPHASARDARSQTEGRLRGARSWRGEVRGPHHIRGREADGTTTTYGRRNFLIATGSHPRVPKEYPSTADHRHERSSRAGRVPENMVIVGASVVGCEYATMFARFSKTRSTSSIGSRTSSPSGTGRGGGRRSPARRAPRHLIHRASKLESLKVVDGQVGTSSPMPKGRAETIRVDRALVSIGRVPRHATLGLDKAGVGKLDKGGGCVVQDTASPRPPRIWAAGDVTMDIAGERGRARRPGTPREDVRPLDPRPIITGALPRSCSRPPGSVGLNEIQASAEDPVSRRRHREPPRRCNTAMRSTAGFVETARDQDSSILGLRRRAAEPRAPSGHRFHFSRRAPRDIDHCVHPHPATIPEGVQGAPTCCSVVRSKESRMCLAPRASPLRRRVTIIRWSGAHALTPSPTTKTTKSRRSFRCRLIDNARYARRSGDSCGSRRRR